MDDGPRIHLSEGEVVSDDQRLINGVMGMSWEDLNALDKQLDEIEKLEEA